MKAKEPLKLMPLDEFKKVLAKIVEVPKDVFKQPKAPNKEPGKR